MMRNLVAAGAAFLAFAALPAIADSTFTVKCKSDKAITVPKGSPSNALYDFAVTVNPTTQVITVSGTVMPGYVNEHDIYFGSTDGKLKVYISRRHNTFGQLVNLGQSDPATTLVYTTGKCAKA